MELIICNYNPGDSYVWLGYVRYIYNPLSENLYCYNPRLAYSFELIFCIPHYWCALIYANVLLFSYVLAVTEIIWVFLWYPNIDNCFCWFCSLVLWDMYRLVTIQKWHNQKERSISLIIIKCKLYNIDFILIILRGYSCFS